MPPPDLKLSVVHSDGLTEQEIWRTGQRMLRQSVLGRADLAASAFVSVSLSVLRDDRPFRHANVTGWPSSFGDDKARQIQLAQELSRMANESNGVVLK